MAEAIISPGVYTNENDQSAVTQGPIVAGAAIVGPTVNGIPYVPTLVTTYSDYVAKFGTTFNNGASGSMEYFTSLAAKNYFDNGGNTLLVTRITHAGTGSVLENFSSASITLTGLRCSVVNDMIYATQNIDKLINPENCYKNANSRFTIKHQCDYYEYIFRNLSLIQINHT